MAKILCTTGELVGMLYSAAELARRLERAGHEVLFASFEQARPVIEEQGLDFLPLEPSRHVEFLAADARLGFIGRLRNLRSRREEALRSLGVGELAAKIERLDPDLILIDGELHEQIIAVSATGRPIVLLNSFVSIWRRPGLPPPHHLARPGVGWKGSRPGMWLLWLGLRLAKWRRAWRLKLRHVGCDRISLLRRLARRVGFDFDRETDTGQWLMPFTYHRLPVLSLHALEFEFPHRPPAHVHYVGPLCLEQRPAPRGRELQAAATRARLGEIFERCHAAGRTLIYAGFGSFFTAEPGLLHRLTEAVASRDDWELVVSLGGRADREPSACPRVHAFGWVPQLEVLRHAAVAVVHGGIHTVDECILAGVPMLVYCGFETDMAGNTSRVVHHGLGLAGDRRRDGASEIVARLERLLKEPGFRRRVEQMRVRYQAYGAGQVAERVVESLLARPGGET